MHGYHHGHCHNVTFSLADKNKVLDISRARVLYLKCLLKVLAVKRQAQSILLQVRFKTVNDNVECENEQLQNQ